MAATSWEPFGPVGATAGWVLAEGAGVGVGEGAAVELGAGVSGFSSGEADPEAVVDAVELDSGCSWLVLPDEDGP